MLTYLQCPTFLGYHLLCMNVVRGMTIENIIWMDYPNANTHMPVPMIILYILNYRALKLCSATNFYHITIGR